MDQELADAAAYALGRHCVCSVWQHFSARNDVMAAILKFWRHIINPTLAVDAYYLKNNTAKCHPDPIWNDGVLGFFEDVTPTR